jgi:hypothetical protein
MRGAQAAQPWNGEQWMHYAARRQVSCSHTTPEPRDPRWRWTATNRRLLFFSPPAIAYPPSVLAVPCAWQAGPGSHVATREKARECDGWPRRSQGPKEQTGFSRAHPHRGGGGGGAASAKWVARALTIRDRTTTDSFPVVPPSQVRTNLHDFVDNCRSDYP